MAGNMEDLLIEKAIHKKDIPFDLLLLADETLEAIGKYIDDSEIYVARLTEVDFPVAVFVLQALNAVEVEIKNIAVVAPFQGKGIGSRLIGLIRQLARSQGRSMIWVGTPDCAIRQIHFYERNGFRKAGIKGNYFIDNYPDPIFENGMLLKDMVMLKMDIG
jgi:ribosomal protein S18 acetylase RimI-like enzyme